METAPKKMLTWTESPIIIYFCDSIYFNNKLA